MTIMNDFFTDVGYVSLNKKGEELCGDKVDYVRSEDGAVTLVLADGLGSGVKANILATLTSKMLCSMISNGLDIGDSVETIARTLPVCKTRNVAYSTFSVIRINSDGSGILIEYDNPAAILISNGACKELYRDKQEIHGKEIFVTKLSLGVNDSLIVTSDGVVHAGIGELLNFGWERTEIKSFLNKLTRTEMSARCLASLLSGACYDLYQGQPGDDTTVACVKMKTRCAVTVMIGPPANKEYDASTVNEFLSEKGKKIVCGGTTSQIVAAAMGKAVTTVVDYVCDDIPPIGYIDGIDLVTEGVLTVRKLIELSEKYIDPKDATPKRFIGRDGANMLGDLLFEEATEVKFYVGRGVNYAHSDLPIDHSMKLQLVEILSKRLTALGKKCTMVYR